MLGVAASSHRSSFGLAPLHSSARLAPPKILDPPRTRPASAGWSGDQDGAERRTDTNTEVTYELQAEVLCTKDSARLSDAARSRITAIAREIEQRTATRVRVSRFTDNLGSSVHGDVLSKQRASAVRAALAAELRSTTVVSDGVRGKARGRVQHHGRRSEEEPAGGGLVRMTGGWDRPTEGHPFVRKRNERRHRTTNRHLVPKVTG
ncbi:OmpA family protein [Streptomyces sp. NPDC004227]